MRNILIVILFSFIYNTGYTQNPIKESESVNITGNLFYSNNRPAAFLLVSAYDKKNKVERSSLTNEQGEFKLLNLKYGSYFIGTISGSNKLLQLKTVVVEKDTNHQIDVGRLVLEDDFSSLKEVIVTGVKPYVQRKLDRLIINVEDNTLLSGNTLNEMLPKLPSISLNQKNELTVNGKAGVAILIDGKGQLVSKDQLAALLDNMKAESVEKIEIISNPSVKYDANGGAVINVITKKNKMTSDLHTSVGQQIKPVKDITGKNEPYSSIGTNLNYTFWKLKAFTMLDYTYAKDYQEMNNVFNYLSPVFNKNELIASTGTRKSLNIRTGFNADLSKTASFDGTFTFNIPFYRAYDRTYHQDFSSTTSKIDSSINSVGNDRLYHNRNNTINLRFNKKLNPKKNEEIAFFVDFNDFGFQQSIDIVSDYDQTNSSSKHEEYLSKYDYSVKIYSLKTDYLIDLNKSLQLQAGGKVTLIKNKSNYDYKFFEASSTIPDSTRFNYKEVVTAAYVNFVGSKYSIDYQVGGRVENTSSIGYAPLILSDIPRNYLNFFPAFTLQYNFKSKSSQTLTLSYNKRIVRPGYDNFNPNQNLSNRFYAATGNPYLNPQFINNWEISYNRSALNVTLSNTFNKNIRAVVPSDSNGGVVTQNNVINYQSENDLGLNISYQFNPLKSWNSSTSLDGEQSSVVLLDKSISRFYNYNFNSTQSFSFNKSNKVDVRFLYRPDQQIIYGKMYEVISLSAGYRTSFLQNRISLSFNANDILGKNRLSYYQNFGPVSSALYSLRNDRYYRLTLRYSFKTGNKFSMRNEKSKNDNSEIRLN